MINNSWINGHCHSNLDDFVPKVTKFAKVPEIGDLVYCLINGNTRYLKVVSIIHDERNNQPYIIIELHK